MFCEKCGKELASNAKFCPHCGAVITEDGPQFVPAADPVSVSRGNAGTSDSDQDTRRPKLRGWVKILIGVSAVVLAAALAVGLFISGVFASDKDKVMTAAVKSISAYAGTSKNIGLPDLKDLIGGQKFSQSGEIALEDIDLGWYGYFFDASALEGAGVRFSSNYDLDGEKLSLSASPFYGSADLLTAELVLDGSGVYVNSPELTGTTCYGLDTMTLGRDLVKLGANEDEVGGICFNIFQIVKKMQEITEMDDEDRSAIGDAVKDLYKAIEVKKTGTETVRVNGSSVKCDAYIVVIPRDAMTDCLKAVSRAVSDSVDYRKDLVKLFSSMGLPDGMMDVIGDMLSEADPKDTVRDVFSRLEDRVDGLGDVELQVYVSSGYIMAVTYSGRVRIEDDKVKVKLELSLGGGKNYVDDLSLFLSIDSDAETEIVLTSHGSHGAGDGTFTDETVLEITRYGDTIEISSELSFAPGKNHDNFSWRIDFEAGRIDMEGQLTTGKDSMELHLEELEFRAGNVSVTLRVDCSMGPYQDIPSVKSPIMLSTLDMDEIQDIADQIRDRVANWVNGLVDKIPALGYIF